MLPVWINGLLWLCECGMKDRNTVDQQCVPVFDIIKDPESFYKLLSKKRHTFSPSKIAKKTSSNNYPDPV